MKNISINQVMTFKSVEVELVEHGGQVWMTGEDIGKCLHYADPGKAIRNIYMRNKDELEPFSSCLNLRHEGGVMREIRVFNEQGAYIIAIFARTKRAKAFRRWLANLPKVLREQGAPAAPVQIEEKPERALPGSTYSQVYYNDMLLRVEYVDSRPYMPLVDIARAVGIDSHRAAYHAKVLPGIGEELIKIKGTHPATSTTSPYAWCIPLDIVTVFLEKHRLRVRRLSAKIRKNIKEFIEWFHDSEETNSLHQPAESHETVTRKMPKIKKYNLETRALSLSPQHTTHEIAEILTQELDGRDTISQPTVSRFLRSAREIEPEDPQTYYLMNVRENMINLEGVIDRIVTLNTRAISAINDRLTLLELEILAGRKKNKKSLFSFGIFGKGGDE